MAAGKFLHGYGTAHKVSPAKSVFCFWPSMTGDGLMEMLRTISGHSTSCGSLLSSRRDKYDYSPVEFQRIIDLISIIGFKIADLAVEILAADMSRKMLCEMIRANYALLSANYSMDMLVFWDESSTNNRCTYQKFGYSPEGSPLKA
ncbi:hypothetical protein SAICODRAFT_23785 [Saitoella complicata NRRL Y-17804]|uniref:uncharacterized protein n=1 Tax=Saitoella complicata (strain BCRC 22490 / CBS 7301 / JCM 7358 / NBRC 10748 / NRRL Y-17804) TaxID=698492 RepID=UPI000867570C|nr:uncharacterized protein SAICODRAFT_23785 [Saitoella complicata NRRL Y-17804]ODQ55113.1 hypothetical protein SAICODRAFT_23785 [Saitoella complicata NRRL Y-17804]